MTIVCEHGAKNETPIHHIICKQVIHITYVNSTYKIQDKLYFVFLSKLLRKIFI